MSKHTLTADIEYDSKAVSGPSQYREPKVWRSPSMGTTGKTESPNFAQAVLASTLVYVALLLGGLWASMNLLRWFWREIL